MKNKILPLFVLVFFFSACNAKPPAQPPTGTPSPSFTGTPLLTVTPACIPPAPTQSDIDRARAFADSILDPTQWEESFAPMPDRVSVTWQNVPLSAVIYIEAVIFPCGYEEPDLNRYFSSENWAAIFQNYDEYAMLDDCRIESGLRLYLFRAKSQGFEYNIRYWALNDTNTRLLTTLITFPAGYEADLDDYSIRIFPQLPNCS